jgi:hypothetical protein
MLFQGCEYPSPPCSSITQLSSLLQRLTIWVAGILEFLREQLACLEKIESESID